MKRIKIKRVELEPKERKEEKLSFPVQLTG